MANRFGGIQMTPTRQRLRVAAAPLFISLVAVVAASCAPPPAAPKGIVFNPPSIGYVGQQYVPKATAPNSLPIAFSLDSASTGCSLVGGVLSFTAVGTCVVLASQTGDGTTAALPTVTRTIRVYECPTLRSGRWTGPQGTYADVVAGGATFSGTASLAVLGRRCAAVRRHQVVRPAADELQRRRTHGATGLRRLQDQRQLQRHRSRAQRPPA